MCRLFGVLSNKGIDAFYSLEGADQSLLVQSRVSRKQLQKDGWGIGWFEKGRPRIVKSPKAMYRDRNKLRRAERRVQGKVLIGHVRWASNPLKLPKSALIGMAHTQPFIYRNWIFAHNGTLLIPKEVRQALGPLEKHIRGNNDSEVLFYWLMKHLSSPRRKPGPRTLAWVPASAGMTALISRIRDSVSGLHKIWQGCRRKYPLYKYPYHGLNWVLSDGERLIAMCYVNPGGFGKARALCERRQPYYQLQLAATPAEVCVASEPMDFKRPWRAMKHGEIAIATRLSNSVKMEVHCLQGRTAVRPAKKNHDPAYHSMPNITLEG